MESRKRKQAAFSITQKQEVPRYQEPITDHCVVLCGGDIKHRTVGDILQ